MRARLLPGAGRRDGLQLPGTAGPVIPARVDLRAHHPVPPQPGDPRHAAGIPGSSDHRRVCWVGPAGVWPNERLRISGHNTIPRRSPCGAEVQVEKKALTVDEKADTESRQVPQVLRPATDRRGGRPADVPSERAVNTPSSYTPVPALEPEVVTAALTIVRRHWCPMGILSVVVHGGGSSVVVTGGVQSGPLWGAAPHRAPEVRHWAAVGPSRVHPVIPRPGLRAADPWSGFIRLTTFREGAVSCEPEARKPLDGASLCSARWWYHRCCRRA